MVHLSWNKALDGRAGDGARTMQVVAGTSANNLHISAAQIVDAVDTPING